MKFAKKIHVIICDDVREEKNNKFSLMGVYGHKMIFERLPARLPKLCIVLMLEGVKEKFSKIIITLALPNNKPLVFERPGSPEGIIGKNLNYIVHFSPFNVKKIGEAKIEMRFDNAKRPNYIHRFKIEEMKES